MRASPSHSPYVANAHFLPSPRSTSNSCRHSRKRSREYSIDSVTTALKRLRCDGVTRMSHLHSPLSSGSEGSASSRFPSNISSLTPWPTSNTTDFANATNATNATNDNAPKAPNATHDSLGSMKHNIPFASYSPQSLHVPSTLRNSALKGSLIPHRNASHRGSCFQSVAPMPFNSSTLWDSPSLLRDIAPFSPTPAQPCRLTLYKSPTQISPEAIETEHSTSDSNEDTLLCRGSIGEDNKRLFLSPSMTVELVDDKDMDL